MTVVKKKAATKKKAAVKKKAVVKKKKPTAVIPPEVPQVDIPEDTFRAPKDVEKYEDGFVMTIIIVAAAAAVVLTFGWYCNEPLGQSKDYQAPQRAGLCLQHYD